MFDLILIGQDISTAVAALVAAKQGLKTILIREGAGEAILTQDGYTFPADIAPVTGLGPGQLIERLFTEWGLSLTEAPPLVPMDPAFQIILPDHRVDLFRSRKRMVDDLVREIPNEEKKIHQWFRATDRALPRIERWIEEAFFPLPGMVSRLRPKLRIFSVLGDCLSLSRGLRANSATWQRFLEAQVTMLSRLEQPLGTWPLSAAYLFSLPERGIFYPVGGKNALIDWILKGFIRSGGLLMNDSVVTRIESTSQIVSVMVGSDAVREIVGERLITSCQWEKLPLLLFNQKAIRRYQHRFNRAMAVGFPFSLHMGVQQEAIPESLAPYVVVIRDAGRPVRGMNAIFLEAGLPGEPGRAPEGKRTITVTVFLDQTPLWLSDAVLKEKAMMMMDALDGLLPFLRDRIDYLNVDSSIAFSRRCQEMASRRYLYGHHLFSRGLKTFSPKTPLAHCFLTGGLLRAQLGFEGEVLAGMDALAVALRAR